MRSPRKDRGGSASDRSGLGAVRRQTRPRGCRSLEQDGPGAAVRFDVGGTLRGGRAGLRNRSADFGGAMRSADLWAARRSERPWREPPAYADRIGRSALDSSYSRNGNRRITAPSREYICESGRSGAGTSAIGSKGESASAGT